MNDKYKLYIRLSVQTNWAMRVVEIGKDGKEKYDEMMEECNGILI